MISKYYKNDYPWKIDIGSQMCTKSYQNYILSKVYIKYDQTNNKKNYIKQKNSMNRLSQPKNYKD